MKVETGGIIASKGNGGNNSTSGQIQGFYCPMQNMTIVDLAREKRWSCFGIEAPHLGFEPRTLFSEPAFRAGGVPLPS